MVIIFCVFLIIYIDIGKCAMTPTASPTVSPTVVPEIGCDEIMEFNATSSNETIENQRLIFVVHSTYIGMRFTILDDSNSPLNVYELVIFPYSQDDINQVKWVYNFFFIRYEVNDGLLYNDTYVLHVGFDNTTVVSYFKVHSVCLTFRPTKSPSNKPTQVQNNIYISLFISI